jgi:hypothetical protein
MKNWIIVLLIIALLLLACVLFADDKLIIIDDFEAGLRKKWEPKDFKGQTRYEVVQEGDAHVLRAVSNASATGLIYKYPYDLKEFPILTWRWKVENNYKKGDATRKDGDDYPARIYVIFPHWFKPMTRSINYIWANKLPKSEYVPNTYHSRSIMIAVQSGDENTGKWITERRNVYEDFKMVFDKEPPKAGGIAIMTDTDNTGESAVAYYDDIIIGKE